MLPAAVLAAVVVLSGCTPAPHTVTPAPAPSSTPVFASDADALAAATAAYAKYASVTDQIFQNGGKSLNDLEEVATGDLLASTIDGFKRASDAGLHSTGRTTFDQVQLQQYDPASTGKSIVTAYVCEDVSNIDVLNSAGKSVVSADRPNRVLYEVTFDLTPDHKGILLSNRVPWAKKSC